MNKNQILSKLERETIVTTRALVEKTRGRFFAVEFFKKDGSLRKMVCRAGVKKYVNGTGMSYSPAKFGLMTVWDAQKKWYRMINLLTIQKLKCGDFEFTAKEQNHTK
jgi:hypothetical protein